MKICYFNGGMDVPSVRFRMPFFEQLQLRGHECTMLESTPSRYEYYRWIGWRASEQLRKFIRRRHIARVKREQFATVVLETGIFHTDDDSFEQQLRSVCGRLVYEIDDAVFLLFPEKAQAIAAMADRVIAGNQRIAGWAQRFNPCVTVIPTCVDANLYTEKPYGADRQSTKPVVGWIGSSGNVRKLAICAKALQEVASERDFELRVITSDRSAVAELNLTGVDVHWININRCDTVEQLQQLDVGIMPLPDDDPWMQYKCNAKMIQYMGVGVPAIGSAIGFNCELVQHDVNSMLAANHGEWVAGLNRLLDSENLRRRLGQAARQTVLQSYTVQANTKQYERAILGSAWNPQTGAWHPAPDGSKIASDS